MTDTAPKTNGQHHPDLQRLLTDSIEKIAAQWIEQLTSIRENAAALEAQVLACVTLTKTNITQLHELGAMVEAEAARGRDVIAKLQDGVAQIAGERTGL